MIYTYHKDAWGFPENLCKRKGSVTLEYSAHAREAARLNEQRGRSLGWPIAWLPVKVRLDRMELIEVEADESGYIYKAVYRCGYKPDMGGWMLCLAILFADERGEREPPLVKTVWMNGRFDRHWRLNRSKYDRPVRCARSEAEPIGAR